MCVWPAERLLWEEVLDREAGLPESLLVVMDGEKRILMWSLLALSPPVTWAQTTGNTFAAYVMPSLFTGRDKEECRTKDVPTVAMAVAEPPLTALY